MILSYVFLHDMFLTNWARIFLSIGVRDFSILACYLSLDSKSCPNITSCLNIALSCSFQPIHLLLAMSVSCRI